MATRNRPNPALIDLLINQRYGRYLTRKWEGSALSRTFGESRIKLRRGEDIRRRVTLLKWERDNVSGCADEICARNVCGPVIDFHFSILGHLEDTCEPPTSRERVAIRTCRLPHQDGSRILRLCSGLRYVASRYIFPVWALCVFRAREQTSCNYDCLHLHEHHICDEESIFWRYSMHGRSRNIPFAFVSRHSGEHLGANLRRHEEEEVASTSCNICSNTHLQCVIWLFLAQRSCNKPADPFHPQQRKTRMGRKGKHGWLTIPCVTEVNILVPYSVQSIFRAFSDQGLNTHYSPYIPVKRACGLIRNILRRELDLCNIVTGAFIIWILGIFRVEQECGVQKAQLLMSLDVYQIVFKKRIWIYAIPWGFFFFFLISRH